MKENLPDGVFKHRDGTYILRPPMRFGRVDAGRLQRLNEAVQRFGLPGLRVTSAQRVMLEGVPAHVLKEVIQAVGPLGDACPQKITACLGKDECRFGLQSTQSMVPKLEELFTGATTPAKLKVGVSGCKRCCCESYVRDIGLMGGGKGWTVIFGGNAGRKVRCGDELISDASDTEALETLHKATEFYRKAAKQGERTARFVERLGIDAVKKALQD